MPGTLRRCPRKVAAMQLSPSAHADTFCRDHLPAAGDWPELCFTLPALRYPARLNCAAELLDATIAAHGPDRPCLLSADERWSYGDLLRVSSQIARVLAEDLGVVPGNRVLLRGPNNPWLVACWFGVLRAGGVAVATMPLLRAGELAAICEIAQVSLALCDSRFTGELAQADVPGLRIVTYGADDPGDLTRLAVLLLEKASPAELADQIAARGVTVCFTAPTAYRAMIASGQAAMLRGLRRPVSAGEHLPAATWQAFYDATGVKIIDGIGSTELLHIFISSADEQIRPGATGRVVPGYVAEILGQDGRPVPDGEDGRLAVKGPTGCRYLADDRQRAYVRDGWNITGDTYRRDADGYFWYQARSDDIIISSGYNIAGPEIEEALLGHPEVTECGVIGVPDEARGQIVKAYVVLADGADGDAAKVSELQEHVKQRIAPYKYPRAIEFVPTLPRTNTGKLQRFRLRDLAAH